MFIFFSCNGVQNISIKEIISTNEKINLITSNAELLIKQNEILSSLDTKNRSVTVDSSDIFTDSDLSDNDISELSKFSTSPSSYITDNIDLNLTTSKENLNLLYSIYNESTVDDVITNMEYVSVEMADEYKKSVSKFYNTLDSSVRSIIETNGGIGSQKLLLFQNETDNINGRTITFETDLSWESVARYTGYSVAAIAGACCYKWGFFPWVRYPGLAVCISSIGFMGVLIARWACSPKLSIITTSIKSISNSVSKVIKLTGLTDEEKRNQFLSELKEDLQNYLTENPDYVSDIRKIISYIDENYIAGKSLYTSVKDIINFCLEDGQIGKKLVTIGVDTVSVVGFCWFTGVVALLQEAYFAIIDFIPSWLVITTDSISILLTL